MTEKKNEGSHIISPPAANLAGKPDDGKVHKHEEARIPDDESGQSSGFSVSTDPMHGSSG